MFTIARHQGSKSSKASSKYSNDHTHCKERYIMQDIREEYNQEAYAWYDFEA
jgi:hypothetical protein